MRELSLLHMWTTKIPISLCLRLIIMKTNLYNFDPLKPHFYVVKLGFTVVYILFFLFLLKNIDYGIR